MKKQMDPSNMLYEPMFDSSGTIGNSDFLQYLSKTKIHSIQKFQILFNRAKVITRNKLQNKLKKYLMKKKNFLLRWPQ